MQPVRGSGQRNGDHAAMNRVSDRVYVSTAHGLLCSNLHIHSYLYTEFIKDDSLDDSEHFLYILATSDAVHAYACIPMCVCMPAPVCVT